MDWTWRSGESSEAGSSTAVKRWFYRDDGRAKERLMPLRKGELRVKAWDFRLSAHIEIRRTACCCRGISFMREAPCDEVEAFTPIDHRLRRRPRPCTTLSFSTMCSLGGDLCASADSLRAHGLQERGSETIMSLSCRTNVIMRGCEQRDTRKVDKLLVCVELLQQRDCRPRMSSRPTKRQSQKSSPSKVHHWPLSSL